MRWWGWGQAEHAGGLSQHALRLLAEELGALPGPRPPVAREHVRLAPAALSGPLLDQLQQIVGERQVRQDHAERVRHAAGRGFPDLVRLRAGVPEGAPDAVVLPGSHEQLRAVLELCARGSLAVVPFGGGTSVVGGLAPLAGEHEGVIALDTRQLARIVALDRSSRTVTVEGGLRAPALERQLAARGLTLGHFPQSFEYVSLGGCAATRSAGQASSGYGSIAKMIVGLRLASPAGDIELPAVPATAAGPGLRELLVGSEGTLGVIDQLSLRVRPAPAERIYEGVFFRDFEAGIGALRSLAQGHAMPELARLSDEPETRMTLGLSASGGARALLGRTYLGARGYSGGCLAILGFEGSGEHRARRKRARALLRAAGGLPLGRGPGEAWLASRFAAPYLRDELLTHGVMVETLETATQWSNLARLHRRVGEAIAGELRRGSGAGFVMCHVSHLYETGASLYFTFLTLRGDQEIDRWRAVKRAAGDAIVSGGGTITHHHAIGRDHVAWMPAEIGETAIAALGALKQELDPRAIMNPGKLLA
jgi:alkyldihydroxyacetonephosphate synthase